MAGGAFSAIRTLTQVGGVSTPSPPLPVSSSESLFLLQPICDRNITVISNNAVSKLLVFIIEFLVM
jgi:hypothetical protein